MQSKNIQGVDLDSVSKDEEKVRTKKRDTSRANDLSEREGGKRDVENSHQDKDNRLHTIMTQAADWFEEISVKDLLVRYLIPAGIVCLLAGLIGYQLGAGSRPAAPTTRPRAVDSVEGAYSLVEKTDTMKDAQITALRKQIVALKDGEHPVSADEFSAITRLNSDAVGVLDGFFDSVVGINPRATNSEITAHQQNLAQMMTKSASTSVLYNFLSGASPARELGRQVHKSAPISVSWVATTAGVIRTYLVQVPLITDEGIYHAEYIVTMDGPLIADLTYVGTATGGTTSAEEATAQHVEAAEKQATARKNPTPNPPEPPVDPPADEAPDELTFTGP